MRADSFEYGLKNMPMFKLNTGGSIPAIGLGTWQSEPGLVGQAVKEAIKVWSRNLLVAVTLFRSNHI